MNEQPEEGSATLAGRADGGEGDGAKGEVKIRRRTHDRRVVAAKFQNGPGQTVGRTNAPPLAPRLSPALLGLGGNKPAVRWPSRGLCLPPPATSLAPHAPARPPLPVP